jgi:hypothetical protein
MSESEGYSSEEQVSNEEHTPAEKATEDPRVIDPSEVDAGTTGGTVTDMPGQQGNSGAQQGIVKSPESMMRDAAAFEQAEKVPETVDVPAVGAAMGTDIENLLHIPQHIVVLLGLGALAFAQAVPTFGVSNSVAGVLLGIAAIVTALFGPATLVTARTTNRTPLHNAQGGSV